jgi:hypothetical protein
MSETLRLVFRNAADRTVAINIPDPAPDLVALDVQAVMDSIITRNVFSTTGGDITSKVRSEVVSRTVDVLAEY